VQREHAIDLLRRVGGRAIDAHRSERNARSTFAGDLFERQQGPAAVALCQRAQVVALVDLQHIGLELDVVHAAGEGDAVVREEMRVALRVLARLAAIGALRATAAGARAPFRAELLGAPG